MCGSVLSVARAPAYALTGRGPDCALILDGCHGVPRKQYGAWLIFGEGVCYGLFFYPMSNKSSGSFI